MFPILSGDQFVADETQAVIGKAHEIEVVGATGAYTKEFEEMQRQLDNIEDLLNNTADIDLNSVTQQSDKLRKEIEKLESGELKALDDLLGNTRQSILLNKTGLDALNKKIAELEAQTLELEKNGTQLQESNVQGALESIQRAKDKADIAAHKAERTRVSFLPFQSSYL